MNKKILISLTVIAVVAAIGIGGTVAYFSDTETSVGNTIAAGALDLTLNGYNNPTEAVVIIDDMKPSQTWWSGPITLRVYNNPGDLYKHIVRTGICCETNGITEPECTDQHGTWNEGEQRCVSIPDPGDNNYLPAVTWFDLEVWVGPDTPPTVAGEGAICEGELTTNCWDVIIPDGTVTIDEIASYWIYLGRYGEELETNEITIRQSFHMWAEAGNEYQTDKCMFNEEFMVLQTNAPHPDNVVNVDEAGEVLCTDGIDNDFDGLIDSADPGCCCYDS